MKNVIKALLPLLIIYNFAPGADMGLKDITVLKEPADVMMRSYLTNIVDAQFAARASLLSKLKSADDWTRRAQSIRDSMLAWTGPLPERTPLNVRVTSRLDREDYIIENILFESRPNFFVSANLYLPKNFSGRRPTLLNVIGHAQVGKADERYQRMSIAQVRNGFVVLTMDCIGQGERGELSAHQIIGTQAFISGTHIFNFMVWDAIRAIDLLVARSDVDASKICMTGSSGGGMMSTYILPFDDRIAVSVPTCNPNTWSHRVHAGLATDHEQVFFGAFARGIDPRGDPLLAQVPKPLLINATTDDNLNPARGVWELSTWLYKAYSAHSHPERFSTTMVRAGHAYNQEQREITYSWMLRWTGGDPSRLWEQDTPMEKKEDLWAASGGSVFNETGSRGPHDLVLDYLTANRATWRPVKGAAAAENHQREMLPLVQEILHTDFDGLAIKGTLSEGRRVGEIAVRTFVLEPEAGIVLPGVVLEAAARGGSQDVILYVNEGGKSEMMKDIKLISELLDKGHRICAVDLRGFGETSPDMAGRFWDFLAGKPIFGQRVRDIVAITKWLKQSELSPRKIQFWGTGMGALYGAFAGVLNNDIAGFLLEEPLLSFESVVQVSEPKYKHEVLLPGILEKFDLPQVYQALGPRPVTLLNPRLGDKSFAAESDLGAVNQVTAATYKEWNHEKAWKMGRASQKERTSIILAHYSDSSK